MSFSRSLIIIAYFNSLTWHSVKPTAQHESYQVIQGPQSIPRAIALEKERCLSDLH